MIIVDGREIQVNETREETLKTIIDAVEKGYLSDEVIKKIQMACVFGAVNNQTIQFVKRDKTMEQCPKCYQYMNFNMTMFCGNPFIFYTCPNCGYDERNIKITATSYLVRQREILMD